MARERCVTGEVAVDTVSGICRQAFAPLADRDRVVDAFAEQVLGAVRSWRQLSTES